MFGRKRCIFKSVSLAFALGLMILFSVSGAMGAEEEKPDALDELSLFELRNLETFMVTATKRKISVRKAPAIATVITADEIRNMGARDLTDVLKTVPGFGISISEVGRDLVEVRGIKTYLSEKVLVMMDGHRLNEPYSGSAIAHMFNDLSVENVRQIEIIRGPGSALYGANAFVAVINVITKDADDIDGAELSLTGGSFGTKKAGLIGGKSFENFKIFGGLDYLDTDGADVTIEADSIAGAPFSMTPGEADLSVEKTEAFLKIAYGDLTFRGHFAQKDRGVYIGFAQALTDENKFEHKNFWSELTYSKSFTDRFSASLRGYFDYFEQDAVLELFPEEFPGYPDGAVGSPSFKNRTFGTEFQLDFDLSEKNHLIAGTCFEHIRQYDVTHITNFDPWTFAPLGSLQDISSWANFNKDVTREVRAVYVQDEWEIKENLNFTAGMRYDHYSDFGDTVNPRAGLVWNFTENADLKLLYGQAFRAPNFVELYNDNNPSAWGNTDLEPETIKTYEVSLGYRLKKSYAINANYFHNEIDDLIITDLSTSPAKFLNRGGAKVDGVELALTGQYSPTNYWKLTYTYQNPRDADTDEELADVPSHRAALSVNWEITKYLNAHTDILWTGERPRASGDTREDMSAYTTVDVSLIAKNFYKGFEIQGTVHNLFDEEYEDPDLSGAAQLIPGDYPREGISALIELSYKF